MRIFDAFGFANSTGDKPKCLDGIGCLIGWLSIETREEDTFKCGLVDDAT